MICISLRFFFHVSNVVAFEWRSFAAAIVLGGFEGGSRHNRPGLLPAREKLPVLLSVLNARARPHEMSVRDALRQREPSVRPARRDRVLSAPLKHHSSQSGSSLTKLSSYCSCHFFTNLIRKNFKHKKCFRLFCHDIIGIINKNFIEKHNRNLLICAIS